MMKIIIRAVIFCLFLPLAAPAPGVGAGQPGDDVRAVVEEVMSYLNNPAYLAATQKQARIKLIKQLALARLDYEEMAKRALDPTWRTLSRAQRQEFAGLFTELLKASYAGKLDAFAKAKVSFQGATLGKDSGEARILVLRTNDKIPVKFKLHQGPQGWLVYDLVIEEVSLLDNFHREFTRIINTSSYAALVKSLKLKLQATLPDQPAF